MKILILTDSRGHHKPAGSSHAIYTQRLEKTPGIKAESYICPFKWTTIPDLLEIYNTRKEEKFDAVILHAGIVDHSPRGASLLHQWLLDPKEITPQVEQDILMAKRDFSKGRIINRKLDILEKIFSSSELLQYYATPFDVEYEGEKTINLYSMKMMERQLIPRLLAIDNLIFISANNFVPDWAGDYPKARPENICIIEDYSRILCESLPRVVNLHQWKPEQVRELTCDNLHLSSAGSDWVYLSVLEELEMRPRNYLRNRRQVGPPKSTETWPIYAKCDAGKIDSIEMKKAEKPTKEQVNLLSAHKEGRGQALACLIFGIKVKAGDSRRLDNLNFLLKNLYNIYGNLLDYMVIEQDASASGIDGKLPDFVIYKYLYNPISYNRGWLYNVAAKHICTHKVLAFCDTDVLPGENFLRCILDCESRYDFVSPNRNFYYSTEEETDAVWAGVDYSGWEISLSSLKNPTSISGGMLCVNRDKFLEIGGFEQYIGYGCEDRALDVTMLKLCDKNRVRMDSYAYFHQFHPVDKDERAFFQDIYSHMVHHYGCEYTPHLSPLAYIHEGCHHEPPGKVNEMAKKRNAYIGDPDMYSKFSKLTINGLPPTCEGKLVPARNLLVNYPPDFKSLNAYIDREEFLGKTSGAWAPPVAANQYNTDTDELSFFYNRFKGKRCFIIGNGPSLNKNNLDYLRNEYTFAVNSFYYKTRETGFRPTFFVVEDSSVIKENSMEIVSYEVPFKFFPSIYKSLHPKKDGVYFFKLNRGFYDKSSPNYAVPRFSTDATKVIYCGQSVTYVNLQIAYFMGFSEVYLIGMDFSYYIPDSHKRTGDVFLSDTDDPNHFHKDYFGKGKTWKDPKLDRVLMNYKMAKLVYECNGRKIYNATVGGHLEEFERVNYCGLFNGLDQSFKLPPPDLTRPPRGQSTTATAIPSILKSSPKPATPSSNLVNTATSPKLEATPCFTPTGPNRWTFTKTKAGKQNLLIFKHPFKQPTANRELLASFRVVCDAPVQIAVSLGRHDTKRPWEGTTIKQKLTSGQPWTGAIKHRFRENHSDLKLQFEILDCPTATCTLEIQGRQILESPTTLVAELPKDTTPFAAANARYREGRFAEAAALYASLAKSQPGIPFHRNMARDALHRLGNQPADFLDSILEALLKNA